MADAGALIEDQDRVNRVKDVLTDSDQSELCLVSSALGAALESDGAVRAFCIHDAIYHLEQVELRLCEPRERTVIDADPALELKRVRERLEEVVEA